MYYVYLVLVTGEGRAGFSGGRGEAGGEKGDGGGEVPTFSGGINV